MRHCFSFIFITATLIAGSGAMLAQQASSSTSSGNQSSNSAGKTAQAPTKRVVADLSGFDLDPKKSKSQNGLQLGAGSRGAAVPPALYAPNLGKAYGPRPVFSWGNSPGAQKYTFRLYDSSDDEVYEQDVAGNLHSFAYPEDAPALKVGATYSWTVQAMATQLVEAPEPVRILLVSGADRKSIDQALASVKGDALPDRLKRVEVLIDHRLWYDSIAECTQLIAKNPNNADLYKGRAQIYAQLPQTQELARQDLEQADKLEHGQH